MKILIITLLVAFFAFVSPVYAGCIHKGRTYPVGSTRVDGSVCQPDGTWK